MIWDHWQRSGIVLKIPGSPAVIWDPWQGFGIPGAGKHSGAAWDGFPRPFPVPGRLRAPPCRSHPFSRPFSRRISTRSSSRCWRPACRSCSRLTSAGRFCRRRSRRSKGSESPPPPPPLPTGSGLFPGKYSRFPKGASHGSSSAGRSAFLQGFLGAGAAPGRSCLPSSRRDPGWDPGLFPSFSWENPERGSPGELRVSVCPAGPWRSPWGSPCT